MRRRRIARSRRLGYKAMKKLKKFFCERIWKDSITDLHGAEKVCTVLLRGAVSTVRGIVKNRIAVQASSLSYATLLSTGPILAIMILFSSMFFRDKGRAFIYEKIMDAAVFVMPAIGEVMQNSDVLLEGGNASVIAPQESGARVGKELKDLRRQALESEGGNKSEDSGVKGSVERAIKQAIGGSATADQLSKQEDTARAKINPKVMEFINKISRGGSAAGSFGVVAMLFTCLLLCINMESSLNFIWNARRGRNWVNRIVFYFAMIFFGSVGTMFGMTFLATSQLSSMLGEIPLISKYASWVTYVLGMGAMTCVLASFYKFIPCAKVRWAPSFVGAAVVMGLLVLNNKLSFLYISYFVRQQNFYGYFAIVAVAMFSLYIFWFVILAGGQISYVVQHLDFISDDDDWNNIGCNTQPMLELAVYSQVAGAFYNDADNSTLWMISRRLRVSEALAKSALDSLVEKGMVCRVDRGQDLSELTYKPEFSPDKITVGEFLKKVGAAKGDDVLCAVLVKESPAVEKIAKAAEEFYRSGECAKTMREIL